MKTKIQLFLAVLMVLAASSVAFAAESGDKIKVLLIAGGHGFEKPQFYKVFKDNPEIDFTPVEHAQSDSTADAYDHVTPTNFDVVVLYDMQKAMTEPEKAKFMTIFEKGTGLVVLHHALCAYQDWPEYEKIIGGTYLARAGKVTAEAGYQHDLEVPIVIVTKDHPITAGMKDFVIHDEIYWGVRIGKDVTPLITTTNQKSMKPLSWYRTQGKSRVVYLQLGHDHQAYENPNYQLLVARSIKWAARK